jgi:WD40 repeat protein
MNVSMVDSIQFGRMIDSPLMGEIRNLETLLAEQGVFSEGQIWQILRSLLPALHEFHQQDIIYQNIQPASILQHPDGYYCLQPRIEPLAMSPEYAAPEQLQRAPTFASDFYSLGLTCIHLLTGVSPFALWDAIDSQWAWQAYLLEPLSERLVLVLNRMIASHWVDRYADAEDVMRALGFRTMLRILPKTNDWDCVLTLQGHRRAVLTMAYDSQRQRLFTAGEDQIIQVWDLETGEAMATWQNHSKTITSLALHPTGSHLASASDDKSIHIWDVAYQSIVQTLAGHRQAVKSVVFSPDGHQLISAGWDKTIRLWDWQTGEAVGVLTGHTLQISAIALSPNGQILASASHDRTVRLWQLGSDQPPVVLSGHAWAVTALAFSPDGQYLASGSDDRSIRIWEVRTGQIVQILPGHAWSILALAFHPQGQELFSGSWNPPINVWQWQGDQVQSISGHDDFVTTLLLDPIRQRLITGGRDRMVKLWDMKKAGTD